MEKNLKKNIYIMLYVTELLYRIPETLQINYTLMKRVMS